jgi:small neutral amino acid transporter SnatA (MarC family)
VRGTFTPRGGGYGVFGEGLTGLWRASLLDDRLEPERGTLAERAVCIAGLAIEAQVTAAEAADHPDPTKVAGAWFIDDTTRMDDQQHAVSALMLTIPILEATPDTIPDSIHPAPMWLLWLLVVAAAVNPIRLAIGAPARPGRTQVVAAGSAIGGVALLAIGVLSGPLLDLLDVSRPAMRLAGASLCLLSAAVDFVRPRPDGDGALEGARAALVPVAVPLTFRPAVAIAGLSVVADHSVGFHAVTLLVVVATATIASLLPPPTEEGGASVRLTLAAVRLLAAVAFAGSALLIADAVFDL